MLDLSIPLVSFPVELKPLAAQVALPPLAATDMACVSVCALQVRPAVVPLLQELLTTGTFRPSSLDAKTPSSSFASSSLPAADPQASDTPASGTAGQAAPTDRQEEEQCRARLIFTAENNVPWIDKLVTQIKVCACAFLIHVDIYAFRPAFHPSDGVLLETQYTGIVF